MNIILVIFSYIKPASSSSVKGAAYEWGWGGWNYTEDNKEDKLPL